MVLSDKYFRIKQHTLLMKEESLMKKAMNLIMVVVILASMAIPIVAGATASNPYRHKDAWFQSYSQGCAAIYRCSCNPVNNYLSASAA